MTVHLGKPMQIVPVDDDAFKEILENSVNKLAKEPSSQAKKALQDGNTMTLKNCFIPIG